MPALTAHEFAEQLTTRWPTGEVFPFIESESADIVGPGHQDKTDFVAAINRYDEVCNGGPLDPDWRWTETDVTHAWVTVDPDGEHLRLATADTPGAHAVTTLWGQR